MSNNLKRKTLCYDENLSNGDCMTQKEFHRLYEQTDEGFKAQLVDGTVFVSEPTGRPHGDHVAAITAILFGYAIKTKGIEASAGATVILSDVDEVEPDVLLRVLRECGGKTTVVKGSDTEFIKGAPELVAEVTHSRRSMDMNFKRKRYEEAGVREYVVVCLEPAELYWYRFPEGTQIAPDKNGVFRSVVFPGLWIHGKRLLKKDFNSAMSTLDKGLASAEHAEFVSNLAKRVRYT